MINLNEIINITYILPVFYLFLVSWILCYRFTQKSGRVVQLDCPFCSPNGQAFTSEPSFTRECYICSKFSCFVTWYDCH